MEKYYVLKQNVRKKVHNFDLVTPQNLGHATALVHEFCMQIQCIHIDILVVLRRLFQR